MYYKEGWSMESISGDVFCSEGQKDCGIPLPT